MLDIVSFCSIYRNIEFSIDIIVSNVFSSGSNWHPRDFCADTERKLPCTGIQYRIRIDCNFFFGYRYRTELDSDIDIQHYLIRAPLAVLFCRLVLQRTTRN